MCQPTQPILVSFVGGTPNDTAKVIQKVVQGQMVLMRFSNPSLQCTGTNSPSQLSCYFPPAQYPTAKAIAVAGTKSLRVHGTGGTNVTQAAWSNT